MWLLLLELFSEYAVAGSDKPHLQKFYTVRMETISCIFKCVSQLCVVLLYVECKKQAIDSLVLADQARKSSKVKKNKPVIKLNPNA